MRRAAFLLVVAGLLAIAAGVAPRAQTAKTAGGATGPCAQLDATKAYLSEGPATAADAAWNESPVGTLRAAVLFVDFADADGSTNDATPDQILRQWFQPAADWLHAASYGRLTLTLQPSNGWIRLPAGSAADYHVKRDEHAALQKYATDAVTAAGAAFDFSHTDILYLVAPRTSLISYSPTWRAPRGGALVGPADHRVRVFPAVTLGGDAYLDTYGYKTVAHETGHLLGLPDLYQFGGSAQDLHRFVGTWDIMGSLSAATDYFAWHRLKLGWLDPAQVVCVPRQHTKTVELAPIETPETADRPYQPLSLAKAVFVRTGPTTGLVVENRQRLGNDRSICDTGALVYTVDSSLASGAGPVRVVGGTTAGCGSGRLSDAPLHAGESVTVPGASIPGAGVSITVLRSHSPNAIVRVTVP